METLFYNQVKNCKAIVHDLNEYHRAEEGTEKRKYDFLLSAVRRHLDRERLETNREGCSESLRRSQGLHSCGRGKGWFYTEGLVCQVEQFWLFN